MALPLPRDDQVHVKVTPLVAGTLTLPEYAFITPVDRSIKHMVPSMCFLIQHPTHPGLTEAPTRFMFDLGLRGRAEDYIPEIQAHLPNRHPVTHRPSAPETLQKNGIAPESIQAVVLSHVHWDHHGDPRRLPNATFVVGHGSIEVVKHGLSGRGSHSHFDKDLFKHVTAVELSQPVAGAVAVDQRGSLPHAMLGAESQWEALGPFPSAVDVFGDGSTYAIPAPGHLPGHINLLCRTGVKKWTYLGGDVFHDKRLLTGEKSISTWEEGGHTFCVHIDKDEAARSIARIRDLGDMCATEGDELEVIVAHDHGWYETHKDRCLS